MKYCDAYQLVSFLVEEFLNSKRQEDLKVDALKVNNLSDALLRLGVDCDFGYYDFACVAEENRQLLEITDSEMVIKYDYFKAGRRFVNWDSKMDLMHLLKEEWSKLD